MLKKLYQSLFSWDQPSVPVAKLADKNEEVEKVVVAEKVFIKNDKYDDKSDNKDPKHDNIIKWSPDDQLQKEYNTASRIVGAIPAITYKIKDLNSRIKIKRDQVNKHLEKEDLTPLDRFHILELKQDLMKEESKIDTFNLELEEANTYQDNPIFEKWGEYLMKAEKFISNNPRLRGLVGANDIVNSEGIFIKCKELMDSAKFSVRNEGQIDKLAIISTFFDMRQVHEQARGRHLKDFADFFSGRVKNAQLELFDKLDKEALGNTSQLLTMENNKAYEPIENGSSVEVLNAPTRTVEIANTLTTLTPVLSAEEVVEMNGSVSLFTRSGKY